MKSIVKNFVLDLFKKLKRKWEMITFSRPPSVGDVVIFSLPKMITLWPHDAADLFEYVNKYNSICTPAGSSYQDFSDSDVSVIKFSGIPFLVMSVSPTQSLENALGLGCYTTYHGDKLKFLPISKALYGYYFLSAVKSKATGYSNNSKCRKIEVLDIRTGLTISFVVQAQHIA